MHNDNYIKKIKKLHKINHGTNHLLKQYLDKTSRHSFTMAQGWLLHILNHKGTCAPSAIAQIMGVTSGAVTSLTDRLYKQGLIKRERSKKDRRVVMLSLTSEGQETAEAIEQERMDQITELCAKLSDQDIDDMIRIVTNINRALEELLNDEQRGE